MTQKRQLELKSLQLKEETDKLRIEIRNSSRALLQAAVELESHPHNARLHEIMDAPNIVVKVKEYRAKLEEMDRIDNEIYLL